MDIELINQKQEYLNQSFEYLRKFIQDLRNELEKSQFRGQKWEVRIRKNFKNKFTPYSNIDFWDYDLKVCMVSEPKDSETNEPTALFDYYIIGIDKNFLFNRNLKISYNNSSVGVLKLSFYNYGILNLDFLYGYSYSIKEFCEKLFNQDPNIFSYT